MPDYPPAQPMEEILASIKRIIADDAPVTDRPAPEPDPVDSDEPLDLGEPVAAAEPVLEPAPAEVPQVPVDTSAAPAEEVTSLEVETPTMPTTPLISEEVLVSAATEAASRHALATLTALTVDPQAGDNTLEGLVRELLRPMLRTWLDANLPTIVERMVAREIARLGR